MTEGPISINVLAGTVRWSGASFKLARRERDVLFTIAASRAVTPRGRLLGAVWPDCDEDRGRNALWVTLHRLRRRFGDRNIVVLEAAGYRLDESVRVDLADADRIAKAFLFGTATRADAAEALDILRGAVGCDDVLAELPDFIARTALDVVTRLGAALLDHAEATGDLRLMEDAARAILAFDPANEDACERLMRALLATGDRSGALGAFRDYRRLLLRELEIEPSPHLIAMLQSSPAVKPPTHAIGDVSRLAAPA